jgi:aldehyde dehydrogenase (NAD+)
MNLRFEHFINGESVAPASAGYLDEYDPRTGEPSFSIAAGSSPDVDLAVAAAKSALASWRAMRPLDRGRILTDIGRAIRAHAEEIVGLERRETGKPRPVGLWEVEVAAQYFEFYGGLTASIQGETINIGAGYHSYTMREPFGVVGVILPWNLPLNQGARSAAPALAAGNTVVIKPSEFTSASCLYVARLACEECAMPAGVMNVVTGTGRDVGGALVDHPDVRKIAFTGSPRTGRTIGEAAARRIIPLTLELGGKSPNLVFEDADLGAAARGVVKGFTFNSGQLCIAGSRLLVQASIHDALMDEVVALLDKMKVGIAEDDEIGPIITRQQYEKVVGMTSDAQAEGATLLYGGQPLPNSGAWLVRPGIFTGVTNDMTIAREEIFGPILSAIEFESEADAVAMANDTEFGLAAGIWTRDVSRVHRVAAQLEAGQIYVNEYMAGGVETPLGGYKNSGYGREKGLEALRSYSQLKTITIKL